VSKVVITTADDGIEPADVFGNINASVNECVQERKAYDAVNVGFGASGGSKISTIYNVHDKEEWKQNKRKISDLLGEEIGIRESYTKKPAAQGNGGVINVVVGAVLNMVSAFSIFVFYLISLESLFSIVLSSSLTVSFTRRESALAQIADFKVTMINLLSAHVFWDWCNIKSKPSGRAACNVDWLQHIDEVLYSMIHVFCELTRLLTLPNVSRARHHIFPYGRNNTKMWRQSSESCIEVFWKT